MRIKRSIIFIIGILLGAVFVYIFFMPQPEVILETKDPIQVVNDQEYFDAVNPFLKNSRKSIHVVMFNVNYYVKYPNSTMNFIIRDLIEAADRGVDVKIVADEFQTTAPTIEYLRSKGIDIKFDDPKKTTHSKLIIIDGRIVIIGSTNWSYYATEKNHESNVIIVSEEIAQEFEEYFEVVWAET